VYCELISATEHIFAQRITWLPLGLRSGWACDEKPYFLLLCWKYKKGKGSFISKCNTYIKVHTMHITHSAYGTSVSELEHCLLAVLQPCGGSSIWPDRRGSHKVIHKSDAIHGTSCYWEQTQSHHIWGRL